MSDRAADSPSIEITENGPFIAHHLTVRRTDAVVSDRGEPMTWQFGEAYPADDEPVALCRCGRSGNRPFCDGTHAETDWDSGVQHRPSQPYAERARQIDGPDDAPQHLTLLDDTPLCMHAGHCGTARRSVWQMMPDTTDSEVRGTVMRMVEKCPSGRLTSVLDERVVEPALPCEINVIPGGPLWVTGGVPITDESGVELEVRNRVTLCRCGASDNKPLCDGTHRDVGFEADDD